MQVTLAAKYATLWESSDSPPDVFSFLEKHCSFEASERLAVLLIDQQQRWRTPNPLKVEEYLEKLPDLASDPQIKLHLVISEFQSRQRAGNIPNIDEFLTRFGGISDTLRRRLPELAAFTSTVDMSLGAESTGAEDPKINNQLAKPNDSTNTYCPDPTLGDKRLGRYRLIRLLGEGAFGQVWLGQDEELQRYVAIKVPKAERFQRPEDVDDYLAEARTVARLDHPHIVPVHDVGRTDDGSIYVVSKFIEGRTLAEQIKKDRPSHEESAKLLATIAEALHHAHLKRLIHRDVKPANILLEDATGNPYLADFGLAIREDDYLTDGRIAGTPAYMSPEQVRGEGHRLDGRSDIFSLGVVFYEMLTGKRPFRGNKTRETLDQVISLEPTPPHQIDSSVQLELDRICLKALSKRASDRYATAADFADDLLHWNQSPQQEHRELQIVPNGLRSFDANDADFFLDLLPSPRNRDGLPESIQFWKTRIEEIDPEEAFSVGLIYGPSGCGKTSLVRAGLLPRLAKNVVAVYVEATSDETEVRILSRLRRQLTELPNDLELVESFMWLRRNEGRKVVIVVDQFEQWLHAHRAEQGVALVSALRQCDGGRLQAIIMVRDDFAMAAARFMDALDIPILQGHNFATVDLFDVDHAQKVLIKFGQAFGKLPPQLNDLSDQQREFVSSVATGLANDGKVVSVRLTLFAEMVKGKPWIPATMEEVGGTTGIGVNFLEETFVARSANPSHRLHQATAREVLKALLPEMGTDIKGHMRSQQELLEASGYANRPKDFDDLIRILDSEIRLITPTEPEGQPYTDSTAVQSGMKYYQLTHDYLVPSLRDWLTRKQKETRRGRAELLLADRTTAWNARQESRQLPSLWEWIQIQLLTQKKNWTAQQRKMTAHARNYHVLRTTVVGLMLAVTALTGLSIRERVVQRENSINAAALVRRVLDGDISQVPAILTEMQSYRSWADPLLKEELAKATNDPRRQLHSRLALLPVDDGQVQYLAEFLLKAEPQEMLVIRDALLDHKEILLEQLWAKLENPQHDQGQRFRAACALADYSPDDSRWEKVATDVAEWLCIQKTFEIAQWTDAFQGVGRWLITPLADFLDDDDRVLSERGLVAKVYNQFAARIPEAYDRLEELLVKESEPFSSLDARIAVAKQKASVGGGLLVMGYSRNVWPLMEHNPDPTLRSFLIERLKPMGVDPNVLMARLHEEQAVSVKRAILMSLGEYGLDNSSVDLRLKMLPQLLNSYRDDPDPGIHGITEWLLRSWQASNEMHAIDRQLATVNMKGKRQWHLNKQGQTMVVVPKPGEFWIGKGRKRQQVLIDRSFAIASKEVTVDQFLRFRNEYEYSEESSPTGDCPINSVSWYEAAAYCNWLSEQEGIPNDQWCYEPNADGYYLVGMTMPADSLQRTGYRLPTIAEWEYACRAGAATVYSIGVTAELLGKYGWFAENSLNTTHPAGSLKANDLGLFDMYGNTSEWCQDYIDLDFPFADNRELEEFPLRVLCGGSFKSKSLHSADRDSADLNSGSVVHGFRLARTLPPVPRASEGVEKTDK